MITPAYTPRGGNPYPPVAFDSGKDALAKLAEATRDWPRPPAEPHYPTVGALMDDKKAATVAPPLDVRVPGQALGRLAGVPAAPVFPPAPAPAPGPALVQERAQEIPAAEPFPGWLHGFLTSLIDDAAYGIGAALDAPCPLDRHTASGWCEHCTDLYERAGRYARLEELLKQAPDSGSAVRTLLAEGWR